MDDVHWQILGLSSRWRLRGDGQPIKANNPDVLPVLVQQKRLDQSQQNLPIADVLSLQSADMPLASWQTLNDLILNCQQCDLCKTRTQAVPGVGDINAEWLFIGEAPGAEEDLKGEPFVGQAGRLLDNMLSAIGLSRHQNVYIANVLKCRPPNNRNPQTIEIEYCQGYLNRQIQLIQPKIIVALGKFAAQFLLKTDQTIAKLRNQVHQYEYLGLSGEKLVSPVVVTYHPAYLLRSLSEKSKAWEDLCLAKTTFTPPLK